MGKLCTMKKTMVLWKNYDTQESDTLLKTNFFLLWKKNYGIMKKTMILYKTIMNHRKL